MEKFGEGPDILEWQLPFSVVEALLVDHSTDGSIRWCTADYEKLFGKGLGFGENEEIKAELLVDKNHPVIRPRFIKCREEQRQRSVEKAEVFTPSWVCNKQNNLVDAAWFGAKSSPFSREIDRKDGTHGWTTSHGRIKFPKSKSWWDYLLANRLEVSCGEAPYLTSRYDSVSGDVIAPCDRIGLLDRKLRVLTECGPKTPDAWFALAKLAVSRCYGFDWQGDNVLLARENVLFAVIEAFNEAFNYEGLFTEKAMLELAEIIGWNIWQMDGIKFVVPNTCESEVARKQALAPKQGEFLVDVKADKKPPQRICKGCKSGKVAEHEGIRCRVMDWETGKPVLFMPPFKFEPIEEGAR